MDKMGEPRTLLPHDVNPSKGAPELVEFDDAALDIIHRIDANMFEEWGYKKRTAFNLRDRRCGAGHHPSHRRQHVRGMGLQEAHRLQSASPDWRPPLKSGGQPNFFLQRHGIR